jgi:glutamate racemase
VKSNEFTIGLFDSGVGGLSVLRKLEAATAQLPWAHHYKFIYLGDTARCPYGNRKAREIQLFAGQISDWLISLGANAIVMACNTSAALAHEQTVSRSAVPVYDLINPTADYIARQGLNTAVLATASTTRSQAFSKAVHKRNPNLTTIEIACPDLVPLIEQGLIHDKSTRELLKNYLQALAGKNIQGLVFGCTHYPFLQDLIREFIPADILLIDPAEQLVNSLLPSQVQASSQPASSSRDIYVTGPAATFADTAEICLGEYPGTIYGISTDQLEQVPVGGLALEAVDAGGLIP